ncbi:MAG TPA: helix-turn-helix domain-containing protein [Myxococcota bacterium]|nr:helix-turn-helix domain-containing protein [Myxococcota bacterium]
MRRAKRARDEFAELIRRAQRTRATRARVIIEQCLAMLPHYRGIPETHLADVRRSVLAHLSLFYRRTLATGGRLTFEDLEPSRLTARRRAAQGVPLGEFLTFFQVGLTIIWEHLIASANDSRVLRDRLLDRVDAIISNQAQLMTALVEAYVEESERLLRFREQDLDDFFRLLLTGDASDNVLEARARTLGLPLDTPHAIAIVAPGAGSASGAGIGPEEMRRRLTRHLRARVWLGRSREGFVALLPPDPDRRALAGAAGPAADERHVGVGGPGRGVEGLRRSAREALRALHIGTLQRRGERVHRFEDVEILDLVQVDSAASQEFMERVLGPLLQARASRVHLETLRQLVAHGHRIKLAAAALSVHPHTLTYRLKQIRSRFGIDLDDPDVRLRVQLALHVFDAQAQTEPRRARRKGTPGR